MRALAILLLSASGAAAADYVLLLENTPGMEEAVQRTAIPPLARGDRMAIMSFAGKARVVQEFTDDAAKLQHALRRLTYGKVRIRALPGASDVHVFAAIEQASRVLGNNPGAVIVLFGSDDYAAAPAKLGVKIHAVAVSRRLPLEPELREAQTPPTVRGRPPVEKKIMPLPEATVEALRKLGAALTVGKWDLAAVLKQTGP